MPAKKHRILYVAFITFIFLAFTLHTKYPNTLVMAKNKTSPPPIVNTSETSRPYTTTSPSNSNFEESPQTPTVPLNSISSNQTSSSHETLISPILPIEKLAITQESIMKLLTNHSGTYGIYFQDLQTNQNFSIHGDDSFPAASTFKVPLTLYLYFNNIPLDQLVTYQNDLYEEGTGSLQSYIQEGDQFSLGTLASLAIRESDNIAANMILAEVGRDNILSLEERLGGTTLSTIDTNYTSANDLGKFIRECRDYPGLLNDLENTIYNNRIPAGIPAEITVAHKIGTFSGGVFNDAGIIFAKHPFVLVVVSQNVDSEDEAAEVIANISTLCYNLVTE